MKQLKHNILIDRDSEPQELIRRFLVKVRDYRGDHETLIRHVSSTIEEFATRRNELDRGGSIIRASRVIEGYDYRITITLDSKKSVGILRRFLGV